MKEGRVRGYRHAGYFPTAVGLSQNGKSAFVLNTKGNGSVQRTTVGKAGNAHDFQGTVTVVDLSTDLGRETEIVARNNRWEVNPGRPALKMYNGGIKHVLYIIKENRTYDEIFGDLPIGNGDPKLCSLGETVMPNHRKLAREFTLFDNGYVSGTNSAMGTRGRRSVWPMITSSTFTWAIRGRIRTTAIVRCRSRLAVHSGTRRSRRSGRFGSGASSATTSSRHTTPSRRTGSTCGRIARRGRTGSSSRPIRQWPA